MDLIYKNLENKKDVSFQVGDEKKIVAIYGKNGVGKTTFSIHEIWDKKYVFNEIFVRENIYISTDEGISTSSDNKKNLSLLFIGDDIVSLQKEKELLDKNKKIFKETEERLLEEIIGRFDVKISSVYVRNIAKSYVQQIVSLDPHTKIEEIESKVNPILIVTTIKNEIEFNDQVKILNSKEKLQSFLELISKNDILSSTILNNDKLEKYNKLLHDANELNKLLESKKKVDIFLSERHVLKRPEIDLINEILALQGENANCFLCGSENKRDEILKWKEQINNRYNQEREKVTVEFRNIKNCIEDVLKIKKSIENEIPKTIEFLESMKTEIDGVIEQIKNDNLDIKPSLSLVDFEHISKDTQALRDDLIKYCINKNAKVLVSSIFQAENIDKKIVNIKKLLDDKLNLQTNTIISDVNFLLTKMQIKRRISILVDKGGGYYKYKFTVDDKEINSLSDGQRHNLALAFFLASIKKNGLFEKTVVLDDPVVCLDEFGYHVLHDNIISLRTTEPTLRIVILTHNIYYLYVQLSNIFENDELKRITAFYRMSSTAVTEYDIDVLRIDDFTLFKKCTECIENEDDLLIVSGIIPKMFRQFIDLKLRLKGIMFKDKPCDDIKALNLSQLDEQSILDVNKEINGISKDVGRYDVDCAIKLFRLLFKSLSILGFNDYLEEAEIKKISLISGNKTISKTLKSRDLYFDMIDAVNDIFYRDAFPELRNYLAHPRQQITKQITSLSNDL